MPKISALPGAGVLTGVEAVPIVQGGVTVKTTVADIQAGAGGYPHWITPGGGFLEWLAFGAPVTSEIRLHDAGNITGHIQVASQINYQDVAGVDSVIWGFGGGVFFFNVSNAYALDFHIVGGGSVNLNHATNKLTEGGFTATTRQYIAGVPGNWGGPGVPVDLETAIDRLGTAVAGLLGGPIP